MMLTTPHCDLLEIDHPILQAPLGAWHSVDLSAAVCAAGGLGLVGTTMRCIDTLREDVSLVRELTDNPFAIDLTPTPFDERLFVAALDVRPDAVVIGTDDFPWLAARAHVAGVLVIHHATSEGHAVAAAWDGADIVGCAPALVAQVAPVVGVPVGISVGSRLLAAPESGLPDACADSAAEIVHSVAEEAARSLYGEPSLRT